MHDTWADLEILMLPVPFPRNEANPRFRCPSGDFKYAETQC